MWAEHAKTNWILQQIFGEDNGKEIPPPNPISIHPYRDQLEQAETGASNVDPEKQRLAEEACASLGRIMFAPGLPGKDKLDVLDTVIEVKS